MLSLTALFTLYRSRNSGSSSSDDSLAASSGLAPPPENGGGDFAFAFAVARAARSAAHTLRFRRRCAARARPASALLRPVPTLLPNAGAWCRADHVE